MLYYLHVRMYVHVWHSTGSLKLKHVAAAVKLYMLSGDDLTGLVVQYNMFAMLFVHYIATQN